MTHLVTYMETAQIQTFYIVLSDLLAHYNLAACQLSDACKDNISSSENRSDHSPDFRDSHNTFTDTSASVFLLIEV